MTFDKAISIVQCAANMLDRDLSPIRNEVSTELQEILKFLKQLEQKEISSMDAKKEKLFKEIYECLETLLYWHDREEIDGRIDETWWDEARRIVEENTSNQLK